VTPAIAPQSLPPRPRWELAWALVWPSFLIDFLVWLLIVAVVRPYTNEASTQMLSLLYSPLTVFLILPWIVRRAMRLNFDGFHVVAIRGPGGEPTQSITYGESLGIAWLLMWRTSVLGLLLFAAGLFAYSVLRSIPPNYSRITAAVPTLPELAFGSLFALVLFRVWLVPAAIRKSYSRFQLQVRSPDPA